MCAGLTSLFGRISRVVDYGIWDSGIDEVQIRQWEEESIGSAMYNEPGW